MEQPCPICHEELQEGGATYRMECGHVFHVECAMAWARSSAPGHGRCAMCNHEPPPAEQEEDYPDLRMYHMASTRRDFEALARHIGRGLEAGRQGAFELLMRRVRRFERLLNKATEENRDVRRRYGEAIKLYSSSRGRTHKHQWKLRQARMDVLKMFPRARPIVVHRQQ